MGEGSFSLGADLVNLMLGVDLGAVGVGHVEFCICTRPDQTRLDF